MSDIFQFIGTFASIFSISLAIILFFKASDVKQNKVRLEIIKTLSYRIGEGKSLIRIEVTAVTNSKIREHNIRKAYFTEVIILEDIIADAVSNPFLTNEQKTVIINDINEILISYMENSKLLTETVDCKHSKMEFLVTAKYEKPKQRRVEYLTLFTAIATILAAMSSLLLPIITDRLGGLFGFNEVSQLLEGVIAGFVVAVATAILTVLIRLISKRRR